MQFHRLGCIPALFIVCATTHAPVALGQIINEDAMLLADDGKPFDRLGKSIAVDDTFVVVSALTDFLDQTAGSVYIFDRITGQQVAKLQSDDPMDEDRFGEAVALDNGVVAVGATYDDDNGRSAGAVYLFEASTGNRITKLYPDDAERGHYFGWSVAADEGLLVVGAAGDDQNAFIAGAVYVFDLNEHVQLSKLIATDGAREDQLGYAVAIDNGIVLAGAPTSNQGDIEQAGAAYLFDAKSGIQYRKLTATDGGTADWFGESVAIDGNHIAIGASSDNDYGQHSGSAYIFDADTGEQRHKLNPHDADEMDIFGWSIALEQGIVAVGARWGTPKGAAYLFDATTGTELAKLLPRAENLGGLLGNSIAMSGNTIAVGATTNITNGAASGAAFLFSLPATDCAADTNNDDTLSPADFTAWIAAFNANAPRCDQNDDDACTPDDFTAWIVNFNAGCD